jgi:hypothetical protein
MIVVAFALFALMILAWLAAPDGRATSQQPSSYREAPVTVVGEPAI